MTYMTTQTCHSGIFIVFCHQKGMTHLSHTPSRWFSDCNITIIGTAQPCALCTPIVGPHCLCRTIVRRTCNPLRDKFGPCGDVGPCPPALETHSNGPQPLGVRARLDRCPKTQLCNHAANVCKREPSAQTGVSVRRRISGRVNPELGLCWNVFCT